MSFTTSDFRHWKRGLGAALVGSVLLGSLSTVGDVFWEFFELPHRIHWGLLHGGLLFLVLGAYFGYLAPHRLLAGCAGGLIVGLGGAGSYYILAPWMEASALFAAWVTVWLLLSLLWNRLGSTQAYFPTGLARGLVAAVFSGVAFYLISGIWLSPGEPNYLINLVSWTVAYFPGLAALLYTSR